MPTVVLGDDRSASSDLAWSWIQNQRWPGWRLEIVEAVMPPLGPPVEAREAEVHPWDPPEPRVAADAAEFAEVAHLTASADPRLVLLRQVDLLVIGPRGKGMLKKLHLGSVAEWVITHPSSPTVLVRDVSPVRGVVIAHDGSASSTEAIQAFAKLQFAPATTCALVVVDDGRVDVDGAVAAAQAILETAGVTPEVVRAEGHTTPAIHGEIERRSPELVVLGTRGHTGFRRYHLGSTAGAITRSADASVLLACVDGEHAGS